MLKIRIFKSKKSKLFYIESVAEGHPEDFKYSRSADDLFTIDRTNTKVVEVSKAPYTTFLDESGLGFTSADDFESYLILSLQEETYITQEETTSSIQGKRPLKTINNSSIEGTGNINLGKFYNPILSNFSQTQFGRGTTSDINISGEFFTPDMDVSVEGGILNSFTFVNQNFITVNITFGNSSNASITLGDSIFNNVFVLADFTGTGTAGTTTTDFENDFDIWVNEGSRPFSRSVNGLTPSGNTGALVSSGQLSYIFMEGSGSNNSQDSILKTTNFKKLTNISWLQHAFGNTIGTWVLEYSNDNEVTWNIIYTKTGAIQSGQGDVFELVNINLSSYPITSLRFRYFNYTTFQSDLAITNITLTSI